MKFTSSEQFLSRIEAEAQNKLLCLEVATTQSEFHVTFSKRSKLSLEVLKETLISMAPLSQCNRICYQTTFDEWSERCILSAIVRDLVFSDRPISLFPRCVRSEQPSVSTHPAGSSHSFKM